MKRTEGRGYDSGDDVDGSLDPMQFRSPRLGGQDKKSRHTSAGSSKKEEMAILDGDENLTMRRWPQLQPIASYKPGPATRPPPMPMAIDWSPRENPTSLDISKIHRNHSAELNPTAVYPAEIEKENTQLPDVSDQSVLEVSRVLSHSEVASARNKNVSANTSVEKERHTIFDDAALKESFHELSLPIIDLKSLGQEHGQRDSRMTLDALLRETPKNEAWEFIKEVVNRIYMTEGKSLRQTMFAIEAQYSFRAS
jgi:hypothetical protein